MIYHIAAIRWNVCHNNWHVPPMYAVPRSYIHTVLKLIDHRDNRALATTFFTSFPSTLGTLRTNISANSPGVGNDVISVVATKIRRGRSSISWRRMGALFEGNTHDVRGSQKTRKRIDILEIRALCLYHVLCKSGMHATSNLVDQSKPKTLG